MVEMRECCAKFGPVAMCFLVATALITVGCVCITTDDTCGPAGYAGGVAMTLVGSLVGCHSILFFLSCILQEDQDSRVSIVVLFLVVSWITIFLTFGVLCITDDVACGPSGLAGGYVMVFLGTYPVVFIVYAALALCHDKGVHYQYGRPFFWMRGAVIFGLVGLALGPPLVLFGSRCLRDGTLCGVGGTSGGSVMMSLGAIPSLRQSLAVVPGFLQVVAWRVRGPTE